MNLEELRMLAALKTMVSSAMLKNAYPGGEIP